LKHQPNKKSVTIDIHAFYTDTFLLSKLEASSNRLYWAPV